MASTSMGNRESLRRLASQACPGTSSRGNAAVAQENKSRIGMILIGTLLMTCLVWVTYSHWLRPSAETRGAIDASAGQGQSSAASILANATRSSVREVTSGSASGPDRPSQPSKAALSKDAMVAGDDALEERIEPVEALARRGSARAVRAVLEALQEEDARVRSRALDAAVNAYVPIPESALIDRAQSDPSPDVRFLALAGIAARIDPALPQLVAIDPTTARSVSRLALSDASEEVRWQAQQILDVLDANQLPTTSEPSQSE